MKVESVFTQNNIVDYTSNTQHTHASTSFEALLKDESVRSSVSSLSHSTDSLLLLLQGTDIYTGYLETMIEHDILTDAERRYLLTGDIEQIEKKSVTPI